MLQRDPIRELFRDKSIISTEWLITLFSCTGAIQPNCYSPRASWVCDGRTQCPHRELVFLFFKRRLTWLMVQLSLGNCSPLTLGGSGENSCTAQPVCCSGNNFVRTVDQHPPNAYSPLCAERYYCFGLQPGQHRGLGRLGRLGEGHWAGRFSDGSCQLMFG